jgi:SAM-dependent methyltransferase
MPPDPRLTTARYYDQQDLSYINQDVAFYRARLPGREARVLELGCGTGRVLAPLAADCAHIHGVDLSEAMLAVCQEKVAVAGLPAGRVRLTQADITRLDLGERFDLITAPFRVFQNLESDAQVDGFFETVRRHLAPGLPRPAQGSGLSDPQRGGRALLNAFNPRAGPDEMRARWLARAREVLGWEKPYGAGRLAHFERIAGVHPERLIVYPVLIYRYFEGESLVDEAVLEIAMRAYYPDEFTRLIEAHGFRVLERWGGYAGEAYGQGPELVVEFAA